MAENVTAIIGLQPYRHARKNARIRTPRNGSRVSLPSGESVADDAPVPEPDVKNTPPSLVAEILKAYNPDALPVDSSGQTIAILIDTFPAASDLEAFWARDGVPSRSDRIQQVNVAGGQLAAPSGEQTLDAEWTGGIATGATIRIYASGSLAFAALGRSSPISPRNPPCASSPSASASARPTWSRTR